MKRVALLASVVVLSGCMAGGVDRIDETRPMRMTPAASLSGVWVSPKSQTVNDWQVALLPNGEMSVSGPGLRGYGSYRVEGNRAIGLYRERNGAAPTFAGERDVVFTYDPSRRELSFQTGIPGDAIVRLVPQK